MEISDYLVSAIDNLHIMQPRNQEIAMLLACIAVDGTARNASNAKGSKARFKKFIEDNMDVIQFMLGPVNIQGKVVPLLSSNKTDMFANVIYEKYRCNLTHGDRLYDFGIHLTEAIDTSTWGIEQNKSRLLFPRSISSALGLACVLDPINADQKTGIQSPTYHYYNGSFIFNFDEWWGKKDKMLEITKDFRNNSKLISFSLFIDEINQKDIKESVFKDKLGIQSSHTLQRNSSKLEDARSTYNYLEIDNLKNEVASIVIEDSKIQSEAIKRSVTYTRTTLSDNVSISGDFTYSLLTTINS